MKTKKRREPRLSPRNPSRGFLGNLVYYKEYYLMLIPGILFFLVFAVGLCMDCYRFPELYPLKGISGSQWVGFKRFQKLFKGSILFICIKEYITHQFFIRFNLFPSTILCLALRWNQAFEI